MRLPLLTRQTERPPIWPQTTWGASRKCSTLGLETLDGLEDAFGSLVEAALSAKVVERAPGQPDTYAIGEIRPRRTELGPDAGWEEPYGAGDPPSAQVRAYGPPMKGGPQYPAS